MSVTKKLGPNKECEDCGNPAYEKEKTIKPSVETNHDNNTYKAEEMEDLNERLDEASEEIRTIKAWSAQADSGIAAMANQFDELTKVMHSFKDQVKDAFGDHVKNANSVNIRICDLEEQENMNREKIKKYYQK